MAKVNFILNRDPGSAPGMTLERFLFELTFILRIHFDKETIIAKGNIKASITNNICLKVCILESLYLL